VVEYNLDGKAASAASLPMLPKMDGSLDG